MRKKYQSTVAAEATGSAATGLSIASAACNSLDTASTTEPVMPPCLPSIAWSLKVEVAVVAAAAATGGARTKMLPLRWASPLTHCRQGNHHSLHSSSLRRPSLSQVWSPLEWQPMEAGVAWASSTSGLQYFIPASPTVSAALDMLATLGYCADMSKCQRQWSSGQESKRERQGGKG